jgi:hypothetical protein
MSSHSQIEPYHGKSQSKKLTTFSTMCAKFIAYYEALGQAMWLKNFIPSLRVVDSISKPLTI